MVGAGVVFLISVVAIILAASDLRETRRRSVQAEARVRAAAGGVERSEHKAKLCEKRAARAKEKASVAEQRAVFAEERAALLEAQNAENPLPAEDAMPVRSV